MRERALTVLDGILYRLFPPGNGNGFSSAPPVGRGRPGAVQRYRDWRQRTADPALRTPDVRPMR
ncbi:hypothetical protein CFP65_1703 [Kitasatospora sp. MMS16-BH015]|uniref:hypothetical protein n=1 Tax=Kitasatospora sp. MMS16-BH015 TaxID=2018025 RepID=UPI000CA28825|nr:hypothetical protein [Kitasatospora sp. MMS16-BH015]AUG76583.1 hypothetical protein CFP65_1703 [Kitasatospora sp. MMS16-BH015]